MGYSAKVLADSVSLDGERLTTLEVTFPRIVLAEFNTHRMFSRNSASSRAIPVEKRIAMVEADPFVPDVFGKNQKGMQAYTGLDDAESRLARETWMVAANNAVFSARRLAEVGVHKQLANRLLEPFLWHTVIVSATEWSNFFALRCNPDAQPEIRRPAEMMRAAMALSTPKKVGYRGWHRPLLEEDEAVLRHDSNFSEEELCLVSVGRCARVSYLTHDGRRDPMADIELARRLKSSGHMSPFEHVAQPERQYGAMFAADIGSGCFSNFRGWRQLRKDIPNEADFSKVAT